jgi:hypothetical protein
MIRKATHDDLDRIADLGADFHAFSPWREIPFDRDSTKAFCARLVEGGVILLSDHGMIGGMLNPLYFNPAHIVAVELFWWASKDGLALMRAFEDWGAEQGVVGYQFSALGDAQSERMDTLFQRAGYRKVETGYYKDLG